MPAEGRQDATFSALREGNFQKAANLLGSIQPRGFRVRTKTN
jgi:hypothetical protein